MKKSQIYSFLVCFIFTYLKENYSLLWTNVHGFYNSFLLLLSRTSPVAKIMTL